MENKQVSATEVLIEMSEKLDNVVSAIKQQDFNNKLLANRLNSLISLLEKNNKPQSSPQINLPKPQFVIESDVTSEPVQKKVEEFIVEQASVQAEVRRGGRGVIESQPIIPKKNNVEAVATINTNQLNSSDEMNAVPVTQRIVTSTNKSIFMAEVIIVDLNSNKEIDRRKTNGAGKWFASLMPGEYNILVKKRDQLTKNQLETLQKIKVLPSTTPLELSNLVLK